jgi:hypothetical protein
MLTPLTAISPVDGRYRNKTEKLADYFSEQALIRYRIRVEVEYFIALCFLLCRFLISVLMLYTVTTGRRVLYLYIFMTALQGEVFSAA